MTLKQYSYVIGVHKEYPGEYRIFSKEFPDLRYIMGNGKATIHAESFDFLKQCIRNDLESLLSYMLETGKHIPIPTDYTFEGGYYTTLICFPIDIDELNKKGVD